MTELKECIKCGHGKHISFWPGCSETWAEPDGWVMDCGCRDYWPKDAMEDE